ncbi:MAG: hypothetical protein ACLFS3_03125 [Candidatus Aenigmatarchaeota archaeon]
MIVNELKGRLEDDSMMGRAALVGSCARRLHGEAYRMEEDTDLDVLVQYDVSRRDFEDHVMRETGRSVRGDIAELKGYVDQELGPIEGIEVDSYVVFDNNRKFRKKFDEDPFAFMIY